MKKRGYSIILFLFEIIFAVVLLTILVEIAKSAGESKTLTKERLAIENALLIDTLQALPHNAEILYKESNYIYLELNDNYVITYLSKNDPFIKKKKFYFIKDSSFSIQPIKLEPSLTNLFLNFFKEGNIISTKIVKEKQECRKQDLTSLKERTINIYYDEENKEKLNDIAKNIEVELQAKGFSVELTYYKQEGAFNIKLIPSDTLLIEHPDTEAFIYLTCMLKSCLGNLKQEINPSLENEIYVYIKEEGKFSRCLADILENG